MELAGNFKNRYFFLSRFSFTTIHKLQNDLRRSGISLTPRYQFHPLHTDLNISWAITTECLPLHIGSSRIRIMKIWFSGTGH